MYSVDDIIEHVHQFFAAATGGTVLGLLEPWPTLTGSCRPVLDKARLPRRCPQNLLKARIGSLRWVVTSYNPRCKVSRVGDTS